MYILTHQVIALPLRVFHIANLEEKLVITLTLLWQRKPVLVVAFQISKILSFLYQHCRTRYIWVVFSMHKAVLWRDSCGHVVCIFSEKDKQ